MRAIEMREGVGAAGSARQLFEVVLTMPGEVGRGILIAEMRKRDKILAKIEDTPEGERLLLEEAEYELLKRLFENFPGWGARDRGVLRVFEDLELAESFVPKAPAPPAVRE